MSIRSFSFFIIFLNAFCFQNVSYLIKKPSTLNYLYIKNTFTGTWSSNKKYYDFELDIVQTNDSIKGEYDYVSQNRVETREADESDTDRIYTIAGKVFKDSAFIIFYSDSPESETGYSFDSAYLVKDVYGNKLKWHRLSYHTYSVTPDKEILSKEK